MSFINELKRRNVFRVGIAYAVASWVLLQVVDLVLENIGAPDWVMKVFMLAVAIGFPVAVIIAWAFELTPEGIKRESEIDRTQFIVQTTGHKLDRIIIGFLGEVLRIRRASIDIGYCLQRIDPLFALMFRLGKACTCRPSK